MPQINTRSSKPTLAVLALALASLALAACGSSSKSSSSTTATASASTSTAGGTKDARGRFSELRECLQKNGVTPPKFTPGQRPPGGGFLGGSGGAGGPQLPKGMTRAQYEAVLKKCGGDFTRGGGFAGIGSRFGSPAAKEALDKFAACMRENGVNVPSPNTSGKGPVFNTKGLNPSSAQFKEAESKCRPDLQGAFRARPGGGAAPGTSG
jgi:hypothetical protein